MNIEQGVMKLNDAHFGHSAFLVQHSKFITLSHELRATSYEPRGTGDAPSWNRLGPRLRAPAHLPICPSCEIP